MSGETKSGKTSRGKPRHIKTKVLRAMLITSLGGALIIGTASMVGFYHVRGASLSHSRDIGNSSSERSHTALVNQARLLLERVAADNAAVADEKLTFIQNQTKMTADIVTHIYTHKDEYLPRSIDYLQPDDVGTKIPYLRTAPGVSLSSIKDEVFLAANAVDILRQITVVDIGVTQVYVSGESGYHITLGQSASGPLSTDYDPRIRDWYTGAKKAGGVFWSNPFADAFGRGAGVTCAMPFYDESGGKRVLKGIVGSGFILADTIGAIIDAVRIGKTGYAFLLDKTGSVIFGAKNTGINDLTNADPALRHLADLMRSENSGNIELVLDGIPVCAVWHSLKVIDWFLCIVVSIEEITSPALLIDREILEYSTTEISMISRTFITITLIISAIILFTALAAFLAASRLTRSITEPIITLSEGARRIGEGSIDQKLVVRSGDEVEELAETFNKMISGIKTITAAKQRIHDELILAAEIQQQMLPSVLPRFAGRQSFELAAKMTSAKEVGGDFYDFFFLNAEESKIAFVIADVSGKGVPAALFMVIAKTLIKQHLLRTGDPALTLAAVNNALCVDNPRCMFVTAIVAVLDLETGVLIRANAGHNNMLFSPGAERGKQRPYDFLHIEHGLPLGIKEDLTYKNASLTLKEGGRFFLYTDGVNEAMNGKGEQWGNERFLEAANRFRELRPAEFDAAIRQEIASFTGGVEQSDDITTMAVKCSDHPGSVLF